MAHARPSHKLTLEYPSAVHVPAGQTITWRYVYELIANGVRKQGMQYHASPACSCIC